MLDSQGLEWVQRAYLFSLVGAFAFLVVLEGGSSGLALSVRLRHVLRNLAVFVLAILIADGLLLGLIFQVPYRLTETNGLLSPLGLSPYGFFAIGFVLLDLLAYWFHRAFHQWPWLWRIHAIHHSDTALDASTALRNHPIEVSLSALAIMAFCQGLGIPMWVEGARAVLANPWAMLQHANLGHIHWLENKLRAILATPDIHKVHHSIDGRETNSNYGVVFSFWDRLFGTYLTPGTQPVRSYGVATLTEDNWQTVKGMMLMPWKARQINPPRAN